MRDNVPSARYSFVMYCVYGPSGSSLLIKSTDYDTHVQVSIILYILYCAYTPAMVSTVEVASES